VQQLQRRPASQATHPDQQALVTLTVVTGPPAGGKTTWVLERAGAQDIVIDFDRIAVALAGTGADSHQHPKHLKDVAWRARAGAIVAALQLAAKGVTVYLIHAQPPAGALARYKAAGAHVVCIDPGRDVVEARCRAGRSAGTLSVVGRWYAAQAAADPDPESPPDVTVPEAEVPSARTSRSW
jgi:hypothetical protein